MPASNSFSTQPLICFSTSGGAKPLPAQNEEQGCSPEKTKLKNLPSPQRPTCSAPSDLLH